MFPNAVLTGSMMGIFAHPDDESLLAAGMFAMTHNKGGQTSLVTATRGELGGRFSGIYGKKLSLKRSNELISAAHILNIDSLYHMRIPDKSVNKFQHELTRSLIKIIHKHKPQIVVTHDRFDVSQHIDHIATARAVFAALTQMSPSWKHTVLLAALKPNARKFTYVLDVEDYSKIKIQAIKTHISQGLFSYIRLPIDTYYSVNHFEYYIPYENIKKATNNKRHNSNKK